MRRTNEQDSSLKKLASMDELLGTAFDNTDYDAMSDDEVITAAREIDYTVGNADEARHVLKQVDPALSERYMEQAAHLKKMALKMPKPSPKEKMARLKTAGSHYVNCAKMMEKCDDLINMANDVQAEMGASEHFQQIAESGQQMKESIMGAMMEAEFMDQPNVGSVPMGKPVMESTLGEQKLKGSKEIENGN